MYDRGKITAGLVVFVVLATLPVWYNLASGSSTRPAAQAPPPAGVHCVESVEFMRASHMRLLNDWRNSVVRQGIREYSSRTYGETYRMSLTHTCLKCHAMQPQSATAERTQLLSCRQCHRYAGVNLYCWDCHIDPRESR
mgnify:CR=1 FL=1